jgi:hypothetical protein
MSQKLRDYLTQSGIEWKALKPFDAHEVERTWRSIYGSAFAKRSRAKKGSKADYAYSMETCEHFLIVPFTSNVPGLMVSVGGGRQAMEAYECLGRQLLLGHFHMLEFFACPIDYLWTMVYTHEDHSWEGPYFIRQDWIA